MAAVRLSPDPRPAIVGSPGYFASRPKPNAPRDLARHHYYPSRRQRPAALSALIETLRLRES
jgi:hypothetical protein